MCYLCLKDNPFDVIDTYAKKWGKETGETRARAIITKAIMRVIEENDAKGSYRCHIGDGLIERLKEEQYRLARQL